MLFNKPKSLDKLLFQIQNADDHEIYEIIKAVIQRYGKVFPDWEIMFLSLPKNESTERQARLETVFEFLRKHP